jgi:aryl-alcohol dehydrogenase-like predicted oxidoreductase
VIQIIIDAGINHIDVALTYGNAEVRLSLWMPQIRNDFFLKFLSRRLKYST